MAIYSELWFNKLSKVIFFSPFFKVADTVQSILTGPGTSLCFLSKLSLPSVFFSFTLSLKYTLFVGRRIKKQLDVYNWIGDHSRNYQKLKLVGLPRAP